MYKRQAIDPRIPTIPGRSTSGFHRPGTHYLHQSRSAGSCWASRMKGELHPAKNSFCSGLSCIWTTASSGLIFYYVIRSFPLCVVKVSPLLAQMIGLERQRWRPPKKEKKQMVPWLSITSSRSKWHVLHARCQPTPTQPIYIHIQAF